MGGLRVAAGYYFPDLPPYPDIFPGKDVPLLHSNSRFDETLSTFQNKLAHDEYALTPAAVAEYHAQLVTRWNKRFLEAKADGSIAWRGTGEKAAQEHRGCVDSPRGLKRKPTNKAALPD